MRPKSALKLPPEQIFRRLLKNWLALGEKYSFYARYCNFNESSVKGGVLRPISDDFPL